MILVVVSNAGGGFLSNNIGSGWFYLIRPMMDCFGVILDDNNVCFLHY